MSQLSVPWNERDPVEFRGPGRAIAALAAGVYSAAAPLVARFAFPIFLTSVLVIVLAVWAHMAIFRVVDDIIVSEANTTAVSAFELPLTTAEIGAWLSETNVPAVGLIKYLLWPLQAEIVRDLVGLIAVFSLFNLVPAFFIWWERKVAGRIQSRMGPMRVGGWHGWAQSLADGIKLIGKEDLIPGGADGMLFRIAPYLTLAPAFLAFLCLPFGTYWVFRNIDIALLFILAMLGVEVVGVIMAGWASNNKWSVYGAMREACQMVSYEIPMTTVLLVPIMSAGTLNMIAIGDAQSGGWASWVVFHNPFTFIGFVTYFIASLANCKRAPFDLPESESELVAGFLTEYSGFRWSVFFFAEYAAMFVVAGLAVTLFLGAWHSPLPTAWSPVVFSGPLWFIAKCIFMVYVQMWIRWTLPRIRIDQVLYSCVQVMFPIGLVALVGHSCWLLIPEGFFVSAVNVILAIIGAVVAISIVGIMIYGYLNGRRMVGYLAVEQLPGS